MKRIRRSLLKSPNDSCRPVYVDQSGQSIWMPGTKLAEQRFLLVRQRVLESTAVKKLFGRTDRKHFHDVQFSRAINAVFYQVTSYAITLVMRVDRKALQFCKFGAVDFDRRETHAFFGAFFGNDGNESVTRQFNYLRLRAIQKQTLGDKGPHQGMDRQGIARQRLPNRYAVGFRWNG